MKRRFFHLGIGTTTLTQEGIAQIEKALSGSDWYRYGAYAWIIYADGSLDYWRDRLRSMPALSGGTSFFLCEFEVGRHSGYLYDLGWNWFKGKT
jgi:hypothetical protein